MPLFYSCDPWGLPATETTRSVVFGIQVERIVVPNHHRLEPLIQLPSALLEQLDFSQVGSQYVDKDGHLYPRFDPRMVR